MVNPTSSFNVSLALVPDIHVTLDGRSDMGGFPGIPVIATVRHVVAEVTGISGYSIEFNLTEMKRAAAAAMGVDVSDLTVTYTNGELTLLASSGGGGGGN